MAEEPLPPTSLRPSVETGERDDALLTFFNVRPRLFGIAYRMRGSAAEAGDVVQDVWMWCFALLVRLAAFAGWMLSRFTVPPRARWVNLVGAVGILALLYSTVSPDDDAFQQEFIHPGTPTAKVPASTRVAPRRSPADLSIIAFVEAGDPIRVHRRGRSFVMDQPLALDTHFRAPIAIHSPPTAS